MATTSDRKHHRDNRAETLRRKRLRRDRLSDSHSQDRLIRDWETLSR